MYPSWLAVANTVPSGDRAPSLIRCGGTSKQTNQACYNLQNYITCNQNGWTELGLHVNRVNGQDDTGVSLGSSGTDNNIYAVPYLGMSLYCDKAILKIRIFDRPAAVVGS